MQHCLYQYFYKKNPYSVRAIWTFKQNMWKDLDISFLGGACVPTSCTIEDIKTILSLLVHGYDMKINAQISCKPKMNDRMKHHNGNWIFYIKEWFNNERIM